MKYTDTQVVFEEIPDEITLCLNISNCQVRCPGCHSKHLWGDIGEVLDDESLEKLVTENKGISCVCFMGHEDLSGIRDVVSLAESVKRKHVGIKVALFSGYDKLPMEKLGIFDYVKTGPYIDELGPLNSHTTNQRMYRNSGDGMWEDITEHYQIKR